MEAKDFLLQGISAKLKWTKNLDLSFEDFSGKRVDAVMKSSGSTVGLILMVFDEGEEEIEKRVRELRGLGPPVYLLVKKGRHKGLTDMLFNKSIFDVKVVTWDIEVGL